MIEKRFSYGETDLFEWVEDNGKMISTKECVNKLNEQQELIEELQVSDEMGWKRAEHFEKKCPKELHNKKMYIKRLEYKVQKFKEENEQLKLLLKEAEDEIETLKESNKLLQRSLVELESDD